MGLLYVALRTTNINEVNKTSNPCIKIKNESDYAYTLLVHINKKKKKKISGREA